VSLPAAFLGHPPDAVALVEHGRPVTYGELAEAVAGARIDAPRGLVFVRMRVDAASVVAYLGALASGHAVALLDAEAPVPPGYRPLAVVAPGEPVELRPDPAPVHDALRVLLPTSGTTGSPKLVRLSAAAVEANARSIAEYLEIGPGERAVAGLPFHYSYGLSVLHSHLLAGATVVLPGDGILARGFWDAVREQACTSFAGVPYGYGLLERIGFRRMDLPALRTLTQAGGRLDPELARRMHGHRERFFVMYGQTEATARIAYVPPERLPDKPGSVGVAIPGGALAAEEGELVYRGPNVMLGYAHGHADLTRGDELGGTLHTGDLGHADADGFFYVTGRRSRFAKVLGLRINLEDVEAAIARPAAAVGGEERVVVYVEGEPDGLAGTLADRFRLHPRAFEVRALDRLPLTATGKVDYPALADA
jgi:acyl-CoA synthetase (AMP-forming)/AMP-acid ligase II